MDLTVLTDSELATFIKVVHEARFPERENDPVVWNAPFAIQLHSDLIEEYARRLRVAGRQAEVESLGSWLLWRGRDEHATVLRRVRESPALRRRILEAPAVMREVLKPFLVDDDDLSEFLAVASESD